MIQQLLTAHIAIGKWGRYVMLALVVFLCGRTNAESFPNWIWATAPQGQCITSAMCADANGNVYVTGHFIGSINTGVDTVNDTIAAYYDIFIAKYSPQGQPLWIRNANGYADANGIATDTSGNIYVVGNFYNGTITFGNQTLTNPTAGDQVSNIFLAKYDSLGNLLWAQNLGGLNNDNATGISADGAGNIFITGTFFGDSLSLGDVVVKHLGAGDGFVAKFNPSGGALWARVIGSSVNTAMAAVANDGDGNVVVAGYIASGMLYIDSLSNSENSSYSSNVFITKYDSAGRWLWNKFAGGNYGNGSTGLTIDLHGNIFVTGVFSDSLTFDSITILGNGVQNIFTAEYNGQGALQWAHATEGDYVDQSSGMAVDADGNAYVTGYFQSDSINFGDNVLYNPTGGQITFLAEYDANGKARWALAPGGYSNNTGAAVCYSDGSAYITGGFQNANIIFGHDTLSPALLQVFISKLDTDVITTGIKSVASPLGYIKVYPNPSVSNFYFDGVTPGSDIEIFDLPGQSVYYTRAESNLCVANIYGMAKGMYVYNIRFNGQLVQQGKIVIQ